MSQINKNFDQIINEEINKPITSRQKRKNNYFYSDKTKFSLYNNPLNIKTELNPYETKINLTKNENSSNIIELTSNYNYQTSIDILNKNNSHKNIYIKKNNQRQNLDRELNKNILSKLINTERSYSNNRNNNNKNILNYKDFKLIEKNNENSNNKQNIININLIKEKNNYIENNIINKIYLNKNNNKTKTDFLHLKKPTNNLEDNKEELNLTERNSFKRRNNYVYHYFTNNDSEKNKASNLEKESNKIRANMIKKVNDLPKTIREYKDKNKYNEILVIKIQSAIRGFLLNKRLDKILRNYINIKEANSIIKRIYKRKIFKIIFQQKQIKRYVHQNIYYLKKRNYSKNKLSIQDNQKNNEHFHLQTKINELIKEKSELQTNYKNLKEFMDRYKQLITEKAQMLQEIDKLRKINNKLLKAQKESLEKNKVLKIQKQNNFTIITSKQKCINKEPKKYQNTNSFYLLGKNSKDKNDDVLNKKMLIKFRLKYLIKNKENKIKNILYKYFFKFYYNGFFNSMNIVENNKPKISVINRRYNNIDNNQNNILPYISIKTLSDNSSVFNDAKGRNLNIITSFNINEEDNKGK